MSQNQFYKPDTEGENNKSACDDSIGAIFRDEREKMGLTYARLSEITRLRPYTLEALENEDWDSLPSSVFVKGFIRSYARALKLEEGRIMELYQKAVPEKIESSSFITEPSKRPKKAFILLAALLVIAATGYYVIKEYRFQEPDATQPYTMKDSGDILARSEEVHQLTQMEHRNSAGQEKKAVYSVAAELSGVPEGLILEELEVPLTPAEEMVQESASMSKPEDKIAEQPTGFMTLRAEVTEKTWVRIFVDQQEPKEYMFRPGASPEWKARQGFELLIGNAHGINLKFNDKKIDDLGERGQVVRLKMPEDYERRHSQ